MSPFISLGLRKNGRLHAEILAHSLCIFQASSVIPTTATPTTAAPTCAVCKWYLVCAAGAHYVMSSSLCLPPADDLRVVHAQSQFLHDLPLCDFVRTSSSGRATTSGGGFSAAAILLCRLAAHARVCQPPKRYSPTDASLQLLLCGASSPSVALTALYEDTSVRARGRRVGSVMQAVASTR